MLIFTYQYKDKVFNATVESCIREDDLRYRVTLPDGLQFEMSPMSNFIVPSTGGPIWLQNMHDGENSLALDLVQTIGEAVEKALQATE